MILLLILLSTGFAQHLKLLSNEARPPSLKTNSPIKVQKTKSLNAQEYKILLESNKKIEELLSQRQEEAPKIWDQALRVQSGSVVRALLLNSGYSSGNQIPLLLMAYPNQGLPYKAKLFCTGVLAGKRLQAQCNRLVTPQKEMAINALVLNGDGSSGLKGRYEDGKDLAIGGAILSDFAHGALEAAQSRLTTPFGQVNEINPKNMILNGMGQSAQTAGDILLGDLQKPQGLITVDAGSDVLVMFQEALNEN